MKIIVYKNKYLTTLWYGFETWIGIEVIQRRIQAAEMKYLRRMANVSIMDKITNEKIRQKIETYVWESLESKA